MTAIMAIGTGLMITALGVILAGIVMEFVLIALNRALSQPRASALAEQASGSVVIEFKASEHKTGTIALAEKAA